MTNKRAYTQLSSKKLVEKWPFSLKLAEALFIQNQSGYGSSLRNFFVFTAFEEEENDDSQSDEDETNDFTYTSEERQIAKMGIWFISKYPGFFMENNKVYYQGSLDSIDKESTTDKRISQIYSLEAIPYHTFICEANKFYLKNYFQNPPLPGNTKDFLIFQLDSLTPVWYPVSNYLLLTRYSSSMKNILKKENYIKNHEEVVFQMFYYIFIEIENKDTSLKERILKTERKVFKERILNIFLFSGLSKNKAKNLVNNLFLTESLNEIISFYKKQLPPSSTQIKL